MYWKVRPCFDWLLLIGGYGWGHNTQYNAQYNALYRVLPNLLHGPLAPNTSQPPPRHRR